MTKASSEVAVCIGTGPSLTPEDIHACRERGWALYGVNLVYRFVPDLEGLYAINLAFWNAYWNKGLKDHSADFYTANPDVAANYPVYLFEERDADGLSDRQGVIHHGHGSGYSLLNVALLSGYRKLVLLGYDLSYAPDYDGWRRYPGSSPRHFFGEYDGRCQHWPKTGIENGEWKAMMKRYETVAEQGLVEVINCSPGTALRCFPRMRVEDVPWR